MQIGQHVLCIKDFRLTHPRSVARDTLRGMRFPVVGIVYTIREISKARRSGKLSIKLVEIMNPVLPWGYKGSAGSWEASFIASHFRPLTKLKVEDFTHVWDLDLINNKEKQDA